MNAEPLKTEDDGVTHRTWRRWMGSDSIKEVSSDGYTIRPYPPRTGSGVRRWYAVWTPEGKIMRHSYTHGEVGGATIAKAKEDLERYERKAAARIARMVSPEAIEITGRAVASLIGEPEPAIDRWTAGAALRQRAGLTAVEFWALDSIADAAAVSPLRVALSKLAAAVTRDATEIEAVRAEIADARDNAWRLHTDEIVGRLNAAAARLAALLPSVGEEAQ